MKSVSPRLMHELGVLIGVHTLCKHIGKIANILTYVDFCVLLNYDNAGAHYQIGKQITSLHVQVLAPSLANQC